MIKKILLTISLFFLTSNIFGSGGSIYTRYGIGDLYFSNSAFKLSLGGVGTSLITMNEVNINNPASLFNVKNTRFNASLVTNLSFIDDGIENALYSNTQFSGFNIAFPIKETMGISFMLGMNPYSTVNYDVNVIGKKVGDNVIDENFIGSGGMSKLFFGASYLLPFDFAIGATLDYYTGHIEYSSSVDYQNNPDLTNSFFISEYKYKGLGTTLGIESPNIAEYFESEFVNDIRFGIAYEMSGDINTDTALIGITSLGDNTFESSEVFTKIPGKISAGLNILVDENYLIVADYLFQSWSKYEVNGVKSNNLRDLSRYSIGFQIGEQSKRFASFWELIKYRGGLSYEQSQYQINGEGINQIGFHGGISFPLGLENTIDIGLMYGIRGTKDSNLTKENIFQASFTINFGELWFVRREL
jgi:hypothetical protein